MIALLRALIASHVPQCHMDQIYNGTFRGCVFEPANVVFGETLVGGMGGSVIIMAFYIAGDGRLSAPSVALILAGALLVPRLPGNMVGYAQGLVIVGIMGALLAVARKYVLSPGI